MPLKINVGLNRKVGEANYGSRGASVNFEVEVEPTLVEKPDQLREKVRYLFQLAKTSVEEELNATAHRVLLTLGETAMPVPTAPTAMATVTKQPTNSSATPVSSPVRFKDLACGDSTS